MKEKRETRGQKEGEKEMEKTKKGREMRDKRRRETLQMEKRWMQSEIRESERRRRREEREEEDAVSATVWQEQRKRRRSREGRRSSETDGGEVCELQNKSVKRETERT